MPNVRNNGDDGNCEIDVMEIPGNPKFSGGNTVWGTVHATHDSYANGSAHGKLIMDAGYYSDSYHDFAVLWEPGHLAWFVDGKMYFNTKEFVPDTAAYLVLDNEVGLGHLAGPDGGWAGNPSDTKFPQQMLVERVTVWARRGGPRVPAPRTSVKSDDRTAAMTNRMPAGSCTTAIPSEAMRVDTSHPTTVVGTGTPEMCTYNALDKAVTIGGIVTFDCGPAPVTIFVQRSLKPPMTNGYAKPPQDASHTVVDGGSLVTLNGGGAVRIFDFCHQCDDNHQRGSFRVNHDTLTLQHLGLINGKALPTLPPIPYCPSNMTANISNVACSTGYSNGAGGAVLVRDGSLRVIDCYLAGNEAALIGPDVGGGALYIMGSNASYIAQSTFVNNRAANAGAIGFLQAGGFIFNSIFDGNQAVGLGANGDDHKDCSPVLTERCACSCFQDGQYQTGSGGNGGAIYKDGGPGDIVICGTRVMHSKANAFGAGAFLTADGKGAGAAKLNISDSLFVNNTDVGPQQWQWCHGVSTDNEHVDGDLFSSPVPVNTTFCDGTGGCTDKCHTARR
jgi:hypothetical protein